MVQTSRYTLITSESQNTNHRQTILWVWGLLTDLISYIFSLAVAAAYKTANDELTDSKPHQTAKYHANDKTQVNFIYLAYSRRQFGIKRCKIQYFMEPFSRSVESIRGQPWPQAAQAHDAITRNVSRVLQLHGGVVLQRFEFINRSVRNAEGRPGTKCRLGLTRPQSSSIFQHAERGKRAKAWPRRINLCSPLSFTRSCLRALSSFRALKNKRRLGTNYRKCMRSNSVSWRVRHVGWSVCFCNTAISRSKSTHYESLHVKRCKEWIVLCHFISMFLDRQLSTFPENANILLIRLLRDAVGKLKSNVTTFWSKKYRSFLVFCTQSAVCMQSVFCTRSAVCSLQSAFCTDRFINVCVGEKRIRNVVCIRIFW